MEFASSENVVSEHGVVIAAPVPPSMVEAEAAKLTAGRGGGGGGAAAAAMHVAARERPFLDLNLVLRGMEQVQQARAPKAAPLRVDGACAGVLSLAAEQRLRTILERVVATSHARCDWARAALGEGQAGVQLEEAAGCGVEKALAARRDADEASIAALQNRMVDDQMAPTAAELEGQGGGFGVGFVVGAGDAQPSKKRKKAEPVEQSEEERSAEAEAARQNAEQVTQRKAENAARQERQKQKQASSQIRGLMQTLGRTNSTAPPKKLPPSEWNETQDPTSRRTYYWHSTRKDPATGALAVTWDLPLEHKEWLLAKKHHAIEAKDAKRRAAAQNAASAAARAAASAAAATTPHARDGGGGALGGGATLQATVSATSVVSASAADDPLAAYGGAVAAVATVLSASSSVSSAASATSSTALAARAKKGSVCTLSDTLSSLERDAHLGALLYKHYLKLK